ncbi:MAG: integral membrane protein [Methanolobus sp. T82-4]|nr:MAG: integral membrane protein [Methanolobus sp. T82-4]
MATFGDMSAALIGKRFGKTKISRGEKSLEGSAAEFITDLVIGYAFFSNSAIAFIMSLVATMAETSFEKIDDNLVIPVFSGFVAEMLILTTYIRL